MEQHHRFPRKKLAIAWVAVLLSVWMGCLTIAKGGQGDSERGEERKEGKYKAKYYHFEDVLVPGELNYQQKKSFIYETPRFKTGTLVFSKWRLDVGSLIDFFSYHMEKDHWKLVNSFKGKETLLNFSKPDKTCTIKIFEKWNGLVEIEIRVGPLGEKTM